MPAHFKLTKPYKKLSGEEVIDRAVVMLSSLFAPGQPWQEIGLPIADEYENAVLRDIACERVQGGAPMTPQERRRLVELLSTQRYARVASHAGASRDRRNAAATGDGYTPLPPADKSVANNIMRLAVNAFLLAVVASRSRGLIRDAIEAESRDGAFQDAYGLTRQQAIDNAYALLQKLLRATGRPVRPGAPGRKPRIRGINRGMVSDTRAELVAETGNLLPPTQLIASRIVDKIGPQGFASPADRRRAVEAARAKINRLEGKARP
jgi:hypothetical protein